MSQRDREGPDPELGNVVEEEEARWIQEQQQLGSTEADAEAASTDRPVPLVDRDFGVGGPAHPISPTPLDSDGPYRSP